MSRVEFRRFPFEGIGFPRPRASMLPALRPAIACRALVGWRRNTVLDGGAFHVRARYALREAFRLFGVRHEHDQVLMPAYHCRTMIEPLIRAGGTPSFYRLDADLSVDLRDMAERIEDARGAIRCALVAHFFGRRQPVEAIRDLLDHHGIPLIEDCAHVLRPGERPGGMGNNGAVSIFCPAKLLPCPDGGILFAGRDAPPIRQPSGRRTWMAELRLLARAVMASMERRGHNAPPAAATPEDGAAQATGGGDLVVHRAIDSEAVADGRSPFYSSAREDETASFWSRRVVGRTDLASVRARRRENFRFWVEAVGGLPHCRPLFREMDEAMAPYVFPLILEDPAFHFDRLKRAGMPMYRWDELAISDCRNAAYFREHLVQLPCHQDLEPADRARLLAVLEGVLSTDESGNRPA